MYALRFKFEDGGEGLSFLEDAFQSLLSDLIHSHCLGFPVLRTQVYYPDSSDLGATPANEFMIEVVDEDALGMLRHFLQNRTDVSTATVRAWKPSETLSPRQSGIWCYTYHAGHLRLAPSGGTSPCLKR